MVWLPGGGAWLLGVGDGIMAGAVVSTWSCAAPKKSCKGLERTVVLEVLDEKGYTHHLVIYVYYGIIISGMQLIGFLHSSGY